MNEFDDEVARRRVQSRREKDLASATATAEDKANRASADALCDELIKLFDTELFHFEVVHVCDAPDEPSDHDSNPYHVAIWAGGLDDNIGQVSLRKDYFGFVLNYELEEAEYFDETWSSDRATFFGNLRKELVEGMARYLEAKEGS